METVYENLGTIVGFSILVLLMQNFISDRASEMLVLVTLISVLLVNANKLKDFLTFE